MDSIDVARIVTALNQIADELDYISTREIGLDMRDQFAMAALTGLLANPDAAKYKDRAEVAYNYADAMLKAREAK